MREVARAPEKGDKRMGEGTGYAGGRASGRGERRWTFAVERSENIKGNRVWVAWYTGRVGTRHVIPEVP